MRLLSSPVRTPCLRGLFFSWIILLAGASVGAGDGEPRFAVLGGKVVTITKGVIDGGVVLVSAGKIEAVIADPGPGYRAPAGYEEIDAGGRWILPGFFEFHSHVGGGDLNDMVYPLNPGLRTLDTIRPENPLLRKAIAGGVTTILFVPGSGTNLAGFGAILKTAGKSLEECLVRYPGCLKIAQGGNPERGGGDLGTDRMGMNWLIRKALEEGRDYTRAWDDYEAGRRKDPPEKNPRLEDFRPVFHREIPVLVHTQGYPLIASTLRIIHDEFGLKAVIGHGCFEGPKIAPEVVPRGVPVIHGPRQFRFDQERGRIEGLAAEWAAGGVKELGLNTDAAVIPQEELIFQAAMAMRFGLDPETALRALTIVPARTAGLEGRIGSIEAGKDADIVVWTGDPLDMRNHVVLAIVNGRAAYDIRHEPRRF